MNNFLAKNCDSLMLFDNDGLFVNNKNILKTRET